MSLKLKAALYTVSLIAGIALLSLGLEFATRELTTAQIGTICGGGLVAWFVYMIYCIMLSRLEYEESAKKLVDQK